MENSFPTPMTVAARQLEFNRLRENWWPLAPQHAKHMSNLKAWAWEILRRTNPYRQFCERAGAIPKPKIYEPAVGATVQEVAEGIFGPTAIYNERIRRMAAEFLPLGALDPARNWGELFLSDDCCDSSLSWIQLSQTSRDRITSLDAILPRQDKPMRQFHLSVCSVLLRRNEGREDAYSIEISDPRTAPGIVPLGETLNPAVMGRHPSFPILPVGVDCLSYVVILFDVRAGEAAAENLVEWNQRSFSDRKQDRESFSWCEALAKAAAQICGSRIAAKKSFRRLIPSRLQFQAQAWIPVDGLTRSRDVEAAFETFLRPREQKIWLPECRAAWAVPEKITVFGNDRTVHHPDYADASPELKMQPLGLQAGTLKIGLPAFDCRVIESRFTKHGLLMSHFRDLGIETDPDLIREALQLATRKIRGINQLYAKA